MTAPDPSAAAAYDGDLFDDAGILDPYPHYAAIRALGPVVWLSRESVWGMGRYQDVAAALRDHRRFSSAAGIAVSETTNAAAAGTTISSDPPVHDRRRRLIGAPLTPSAVPALRPRIQAAADALTDRLVGQRSFDAATEFAQHLPLTLVSHMIGLPEEGRGGLLPYAAATFDLAGPENDRARTARPIVMAMRGYMAALSDRSLLLAGGWADRLLDHVDTGEITRDEYLMLLRDYLGPSLDTTIFATANLIWLFARFPDQWDRLRAEPGLIRGAIDEAIRLETPIRGFTRQVCEPVEVDGVTLDVGARVLLLYASANRDERKWDDPERFDITRRTKDHLGFGLGIHSCAGTHLARLEIECLLTALLPRVRSFAIGTPVRAVNNLLRGFASLPVTVRT